MAERGVWVLRKLSGRQGGFGRADDPEVVQRARGGLGALQPAWGVSFPTQGMVSSVLWGRRIDAEDTQWETRAASTGVLQE